MRRRKFRPMWWTNKSIRNKIRQGFWLFIAITIFSFCVVCFLPFILTIVIPILILISVFKKDDNENIYR